MTTTRSTIRRPHGGFTLLEVLIAFAVLGLGLIMVAALFPAALLEHARTVDRSRALDLATNAEAMLHNRLDGTQLYVNNVDLANGFDSPWYAIPFHNMTARNTNTFAPGTPNESDWDNAVYPPVAAGQPYPTQVYYARVNNTPVSYFVNLPQLFGVDYLSDSILPRTDAIANKATSRLVWHGFYRVTASGTRHFAVAVCKQRQNKEFARQFIPHTGNVTNPYANAIVLQKTLGDYAADAGPTTNVDTRARFPVPWRVTVARLPNSQILTMPGLTFGGISLARLAPKGSKLLIQGRTYTNTGGGVLDFPGGRVLTVVDTDDNNRIQVLENIGDIRAYDPNVEAFEFDVWLFPPPITGSYTFEKESPILEWKVSL